MSGVVMLKFLRNLFLFLSALGSSIVVGWWLTNRQSQSKPNPTPPSRPAPSSQAAAPVIKVMSQITLPPEAFEDIDPSDNATTQSASPETNDNALTQLKGIGPKTLDALTEIGIHTIADLAKASADDLKERLSLVRPSLKQIEQWIDAAKDYTQK